MPRTDSRCVTCQRLCDRLNSERERLEAISTKQFLKLKKREQARERHRSADLPRVQIEAVFTKHKCPAVLAKVNRGYTIYHEGQAVSRIRQRGKAWEVLWWSHRDKWETIGDFGGVICDTVEEAAEYVLEDPMGIFWR